MADTESEDLKMLSGMGGNYGGKQLSEEAKEELAKKKLRAMKKLAEQQAKEK